MTNYMLNATCKCSLLLTVIVYLGACRPSLCPEAKQVRADYLGDCIAKLTYHKGGADVTILPHPQCPWERLVDLRIFNNFRPGMKIEEARSRFGPPDVELSRNAESFWRYRGSRAIIQIGHEDQGSGIIPFYYWWTLSAFPKDPALEAFFSPEVVARLAQLRENYGEIFVLNQCGLSMIVVSIEDGKIQAINWTRNPGSYNGPGS